MKTLNNFMKTLNNILKVLLLNIVLIGTSFADTECPKQPIYNNDPSPENQLDVVINGVLCGLIQLKEDDKYKYLNIIGLIEKQVIPFVNIDYFNELAFGKYWNQLKQNEKNTFKNKTKKSLTNDLENYISLLLDYNELENIRIEVDEKNIIINEIKSETKIYIYDKKNKAIYAITLKTIRNNGLWQVYDLVYQNMSILDVKKMTYKAEISRYGLYNFIRKN